MISADYIRRIERHRFVGMLSKRPGIKDRVQQVVLCGDCGQNAGLGVAAGYSGAIDRLVAKSAATKDRIQQAVLCGNCGQNAGLGVSAA